MSGSMFMTSKKSGCERLLSTHAKAGRSALYAGRHEWPCLRELRYGGAAMAVQLLPLCLLHVLQSAAASDGAEARSSQRMKVGKGSGLMALLGSVLAIFGTAMAPCCFPLLGATFGLLGASGWISGSPWLTQAGAILVVAALLGTRHRYNGTLSVILGTVGAASILLYYHLWPQPGLVYSGIVLLLVGTLGTWAVRRTFRLLRIPILRSVLACPSCGGRKAESMPQDSCLFFWICPRCEERIRPLPGDCCVFCSYGNVPCPPVQLGICSC